MNKITLETSNGAYSVMSKSLEEAVRAVLRAYGLKDADFKLTIKENEKQNN